MNTCYVSSILSYSLPSRHNNLKSFRGFAQRTCLVFCCGPVAVAVPPDSHLHCKAILWLFFMKYNIQKLNLLLKMGISKTAWINSSVDTIIWLNIFLIFKNQYFIINVYPKSSKKKSVWAILSKNHNNGEQQFFA